MQIMGLQKLTLLDYPNTLACTVFTGGCNLRCPFCHNAVLVQNPESQPPVSQEELFAFLEKRRGVLEGVCITGGEPTLQPGLPEFMTQVRSLGYRVKLDTNGTRPDVLRRILDAGLADLVAMDVKNCPARYAETVGAPDFDLTPIQESLDLLRGGATPYLLRTTVVRELHTLEDLRAMAEWLGPVPRFALQTFRDSGGCIQPGLHSVEPQVMDEMAALLRQTIPQVTL